MCKEDAEFFPTSEEIEAEKKKQARLSPEEREDLFREAVRRFKETDREIERELKEAEDPG